ncbi:XRE family transcriptional regulator, partial [Enterococcus faecium]
MSIKILLNLWFSCYNSLEFTIG